MVPNSKVVKMKMGDQKGYDSGQFPIRIDIVSKERVQLRDNAIEAVRQYLNRFLQSEITEFYLEVCVYPHHVLRENKMLQGAGADRMQTGMSHSYGKSVGRAALIKPNQTMFIVAVKNPKHEAEARKLISAMKARLPCAVTTRTYISKPQTPVPIAA